MCSFFILVKFFLCLSLFQYCYNTFSDLPKNCQVAKEMYGMETSRGVLIWPDQNIDNDPFIVHCDVESFPDLGKEKTSLDTSKN